MRQWIKRIFLGLSLAFGAVVAAVGGDMALRLRHEGRPLTEQETELVRVTFDDEVDYSKVRRVSGKISYFQDDKTVVTLGNTIYDPPPKETAHTPIKISIGYRPPKAADDLLTHETGHVWQNQHHVKGAGIIGAFRLWAQARGKDVYTYKLDPAKKLIDYNLEQQADIFEDYAVISKNMANDPAMKPPQNFALLKKIVEEAILPQKPAMLKP